MPEIEYWIKEEIDKLLPVVMKRAFSSYKNFSNTAKTKDSAKFKAHHDAGKVAVAHIKLLIDLARCVDSPKDKNEVLSKNKQKLFNDALTAALSEVDNYKSSDKKG